MKNLYSLDGRLGPSAIIEQWNGLTAERNSLGSVCFELLRGSQHRRPYNLYCVGEDVKPCSINQGSQQMNRQ